MALNEINPGGTPGNAERDSGLDRLYRATGREEPPARLDAAILAAARREVGARPRTQPHALRRWQVPVSIAAVVVLSVSLVTVVREEGGEQLMRAPASAPAQPPVAEPAPSAPAVSEMARPRPPGSAPAPSGSAPREAPSRADGASASLDRMSESATSGITGPMLSQGAGSAGAPDAAARKQPKPFRDAPGLAEQRAAAPQAAPPVEDLAAKAPAAAERSVAPMAVAPAPKPAPLANVMMGARKETASADAPAPVWQGFEKEPAQRWLERIAELRRLERVADADAMLAEFKRRFPGHPLPPALP